jgi:hypothetical protein
MSEDYIVHFGKALTEFVAGFTDYVLAAMKKEYPDSYSQKITEYTSYQKQDKTWDAPMLISIILSAWTDVFSKKTGWTTFHRNLLYELRYWRNQWAHHTPFDAQDAYRACDGIYRLLKIIDTDPQHLSQVFMIKNWLVAEAAKKVREDYLKKKAQTGISTLEKLDTMDVEEF